MKEKIKQLSKGVFEYTQPCIVLSEESLTIQVEEGKTYEGSFTIRNDANTELKGIVYSSNSCVKIQNAAFIGADNVIEYQCSTNGIRQGETINGVFSIVSSCGEVELPFQITMEAPFVYTSIGKIKDLFLFANLAKTEPAEAVKLFQSEDFERVFLQGDMITALAYRSLMKGNDPYHAMEEFLIVNHKKPPIQISVPKTNLEYQAREESFMDKIIITKNHWGYAEYHIHTDAPFIHMEYETIHTDHFNGNTYSLEFVLDGSLMRNGINYGRIFIESIYQTIEITIKVYCNKGYVLKEEGHSKKSECMLHLLTNYLNFRTHKMDAFKYADDSKSALALISNYSRSNLISLIRTHLNLISGQESLVREQLEVFHQDLERMKKSSPLEYCGYLYLDALFTADSAVTQKAVEEITVYYQNGYKQWQILWFLLYLDKRYENGHMKLAAIKEQLRMGCHSPILYYEACSVYNEEPEHLTELDREAILSINWGIKADILSAQAIMQYVYLAGREKTFNRLIFQGLSALYNKEPSKDILFAICSMLIKGHMIGAKYFSWYQAGVMEQLRITELHEHYMYSLNENHKVVLPQPILLYFVYNSTLSERKKAFLYANIIHNKTSNTAIYHTYIKQMEGFARRQLLAHGISPCLAVLYEEFFRTAQIEEYVAKNLPYVLYQHEVICDNPSIVGAYVVHKELDEEEFVPFMEGRAQVSIFSDHAQLILVDNKNNRYIGTIPYTINRLLPMEELEPICYDTYPDNKMLLISMYDKIEAYQKYDQNSVHIRKLVYELPSLREQYKMSVYSTLVQYYYDTQEETSLEEMLMKACTNPININDCGKIIEYCIVREFYENAVFYIKLWGFEHVPLNRLNRLGKKLLANAPDQRDEFLIRLAFYLYQTEKYDVSILSYLVNYYSGTTNDMFRIWKAGKEAGLNCIQLEESLLGQMLFTENNLVAAPKVFLSYYNHADNPKLVRAFLSYCAYKYLLKDRVIDEGIFDIFRKELVYEENQAVLLALLKYYSDKQNLSDEDISFVDYNIHKLLEQGMVLPFFQKFRGKIFLPSKILNQHFVEYISDPRTVVKIHYRRDQDENGEEFVTEVMEDMFEGIHSKGFLLFYNEVVQYYITEEFQGEEKITESYHLKMDSKLDEKCENKYNLINLMLMAKEMKDEKTLIDLMKQYIRTDYVEKQLFKPL